MPSPTPRNKDAGFEHLRQAFADLLPEIEFPPGVFVTVLGAKIAANSAHATITLSVFPDGKEPEVLQALKNSMHDLKDGLANTLRLRRIPNFHFEFDRTESEAAHIERALNEMKEKGEI
jgi:ribosome-binding factor A